MDMPAGVPIVFWMGSYHGFYVSALREVKMFPEYFCYSQVLGETGLDSSHPHGRHT